VPCRACQGALLGEYRIVQRSFFMISVLRANRPNRLQIPHLGGGATHGRPCGIFDGAPKSCTYCMISQHSPITQGSAHLQVARAPLVPPPLTAPPSRCGDPAIASLQNLRWCPQKLHLPQGHASLPDHARQRTSAESTCASGAAAPHRPALSPRRRKMYYVCASRSPHGFVGVGERITPCAH
jgi:hypothetical protein